MSDKPYTEILLENGNRFRVFSESVDTSDLVWHQDQHDRKIYVHESKGWSLQFDNQLPVVLEAGNVYTVPRDTWHRVIKGDSNLVLQIREEMITEDNVVTEGLDDVDLEFMMKLETDVQKFKEGLGGSGMDKSYSDNFLEFLGDRIDAKTMRDSGLREGDLQEEKGKSKHEPQYSAPEGSKRDKQLDATKADLASGDPERKARAYRRRERMERQEREKNESFQMSESDLRTLIREVLMTEAIMNEELSAKTKATLKKKAEERGFTAGSVEQEYKKGLAAWASSGSRKGMTQHQWAMARVNSASPSKSWAVVKKSKAKKK